MNDVEQAIERLRTLSEPPQGDGGLASDVDVVLAEIGRLEKNVADVYRLLEESRGIRRELVAERKIQKAIVDALPMCNRLVNGKQVPDVPVVPGMIVWFWIHDGTVRQDKIEQVERGWAHGGTQGFEGHELYDTPKAAEHAAKAKGKPDD